MVTISSVLILEKNSLYITLKKSPTVIKETDDLDFIKKIRIFVYSKSSLRHLKYTDQEKNICNAHIR